MEAWPGFSYEWIHSLGEFLGKEELLQKIAFYPQHVLSFARNFCNIAENLRYLFRKRKELILFFTLVI